VPPTLNPDALAASPAPLATSLARPWPLWLAISAFSLLWLDLCRQLSYEWSTNEQYAYGWFVPIFALGLFLKQWPTRPSLSLGEMAGVRASSPLGAPFSGFRFPLSAFPIFLALAYLPLRIIHEINQDWSFCSYLLTLVVVGLSLYAIFLMGGWPWVRHFAFPICFILVAVRWPYRIENSLKYRLMGAVASSTVEIAGWLNIPALQHGNVIELATSSVGVEDACSGIRSLQSTIMGAFLLGELYLLKWPHRFLLIALGIPLAFCFNIGRTLFLTWQASVSGNGAVAKWHDSAGITISVATFLCLWLLATFLKKRAPSALNSQPPTLNCPPALGLQPSVFNSQPSTLNRPKGDAAPKPATFNLKPEPGNSSLSSACRAEAASEGGGERAGVRANSLGSFRCAGGDGHGDADPQPATCNLQLPTSPSSLSAGGEGRGEVVLQPVTCNLQPATTQFPLWFSVSLALWVLLCLAATEAWYRVHDTDPAKTVRWTAQFPTNSPTARKIFIDKDTRKVLKYDQGTALSWDEPDGNNWSAFFFRWREGEATSRMAARDHRPEICLPSTGYRLKTDSGIHFMPAQGLELPFRAYTFEEAGRVLHVFFCLWEDGAEKQAGLGKSKYLDRLDSVLAGKRRVGQQTLEIIISGYKDMEEAELALRQRLPNFIQLGVH
jgi:exosortase